MITSEGYRCDECTNFSELPSGDGPPGDWFLLARMKTGEAGWWEDTNEWHFCSESCLRTWKGMWKA